MRVHRVDHSHLFRASAAFTIGAAVLLAACSGDVARSDEPDGGTSGATAVTSPASAPGATGTATSPASAGGADLGELDVCALVSQEEVESVIGMPAGAAQAEEPSPPFFGCRFEDDALTQVVTVGVISWDDEETAESSFDFGAEDYPAVEGIGDRAYNAQPVNDITVLAGRYELSVGLYFISDDDEVELAMARDLAALALDRLP